MHALGAGGLRPISYTLPNGRMAIMGCPWGFCNMLKQPCEKSNRNYQTIHIVKIRHGFFRNDFIF